MACGLDAPGEENLAPEVWGRGKLGGWELGERAYLGIVGAGIHSPLGAERLKMITREMGPSCRTVQVCKISVWRVGTPDAACMPALPTPSRGLLTNSAGFTTTTPAPIPPSIKLDPGDNLPWHQTPFINYPSFQVPLP